MAIPSGLDAQLMVGEQTDYSTPATVDSGFEFRSESLSLDSQRIESSAFRPGQRVLRSNRWRQSQKSTSGDVTMELATVSMGTWFKHMFGSVSTSQPDATNAASVYEHTFTPGPLKGKNLTVQVGRPDESGTVQPFTYPGCKVSSWTLSSAVGEFATLAVSLVGQDEDTTTSLETASYPADIDLLTFVDGSITIAGSAVDVRSISLEGTNGLATDDYVHGARTRREPTEVGTEGSQARTYTGTIEKYFADLTAYNRFVQGTEAEMVLLYEGTTIEGTFNYAVEVTANVRFDGTTPQVSDTSVLMQSLPIKVIDNGTTSISALYRTTDQTV
ncbi:hypothetical protein SAMN04487905_10622 [Actinopolyspora xinjiangensis]|uniref:Major tail protein n=1 Tax=Actinopolyspora xinjiangensis TaxID=405564 RepID=A0A1H0U3H9_9ACTN|nr:phage tail tube protein [Actinopolyspora xinjiangensis]SDP60701.1 hypothetical protein SAMN04487905_10622 [Actinopolyspora xinjiangensis]